MHTQVEFFNFINLHVGLCNDLKVLNGINWEKLFLPNLISSRDGLEKGKETRHEMKE